MQKATLLIDGDILAYQASSSVQRDIDWGDGLWTCHAFLDDAVEQFQNILFEITSKFENPYTVFCFSDEDNFRKTVYPEYKSNRLGKRKPTCYKALVGYIRQNYPSHSLPHIEGDDVIGILATANSFDSPIIVSMDKDMKTIPGKFYNFNKDELLEITNEQAHYWHMYQTLTGDTTDGYSGCPSYGPVKAKKLLDSLDTKDYCDAVIEAYKKNGLSYEDFLTQARLAFILRYGWYDLDKKLPKLWEPCNKTNP